MLSVNKILTVNIFREIFDFKISGPCRLLILSPDIFQKFEPDRTSISILVRSGPDFYRYGDFSFLWILKWTLYFSNFLKFCSGPRTGPKKKNPPRYGFYGPKSVPRTGPGLSSDQIPDHVPDRKNSGPKIRTTDRTNKSRTKNPDHVPKSGPVRIFGTVRSSMLYSN